VTFSRPIYRFLLGRHFGVAAALAAVPALIGAVLGALLNTHLKQRATARTLIEGLPVFRRLVDDETLDFLSTSGYLGFVFKHPLTFLAFALAVGAPALTTPAGDRGRGALDLLLASPVSRRGVVRASAAVTATCALLAALGPFLGAVVGALVSGRWEEAPIGRYAIASANAAAFCLCLGAVALLLSAGAEDGVSAARRFSAFFLLAMLADALSLLWDDGAWLRWITPGGYYRASETIAGKADHALHFGALLGAALLAWIMAERVAERRRRA